jgi:hypothetical protein
MVYGQGFAPRDWGKGKWGSFLIEYTYGRPTREEIESDVCSAGMVGLLSGLCTNLALWCGCMDCSGF